MSEARVRNTSALTAEDVVPEAWEAIPDRHATLRGRCKYPFHELVAKTTTLRIHRPISTVRSALANYASRHGGKYVCRDVGGGWTKIWRLK